jgi:O-acetyl-ADP-ribose deacetylase (regulator of RNase III)
VVQADITDIVVDGIVHPTNNAFYLGGEVGSAISRVGGQKVRNQVQELHRTNGNLATCGGKID